MGPGGSFAITVPLKSQMARNTTPNRPSFAHIAVCGTKHADWNLDMLTRLPDATEATCQARLQLYFPDSYQEIMQDRVRFIKWVEEN